MINMAYLLMIGKADFFKYPTTPKLLPTKDMIISDIKSETEFKNYIIGTTLDPKLKTIHSCISLHLPPWIFAAISPQIRSKIKTLFKATLDAAITKSYCVAATAPVITPSVN